MLVTETDLPGIPLVARGKVRDVYAVDDALLFLATDRISAFDHILPQGIPDKGRVLTQISLFWFRRLQSLVPHHVISARVDDYPDVLKPHAEMLAGRSMLVRKLDMVPVECVVRGYLVGSGWKEYQEGGTVCGIRLPAGLEQASRLPEPIFTPATKATDGHDENISFERMVDIVGAPLAERLRALSMDIYAKGVAHARSRGILLADTKFEFGIDGDQIILADEVLTPDSSRFWAVEDHRTGISPPSYDKQYVRDHLESVHWNKQPPAPDLPDEIVAGARSRYLEIYEKLTGTPLPD